MKKSNLCPHCNKIFTTYSNPFPTVDVIIYDPQCLDRGIVLIERSNPPYGFALPGGFIDEGESAEHAAIREMQEETSLSVELVGVLGVYSKPNRDPRFHTLSITFVGKTINIKELCSGDDAKSGAFFPLHSLPELVFDHAHIIDDFILFLANKRHLIPINA